MSSLCQRLHTDWDEILPDLFNALLSLFLHLLHPLLCLLSVFLSFNVLKAE